MVGRLILLKAQMGLLWPCFPNPKMEMLFGNRGVQLNCFSISHWEKALSPSVFQVTQCLGCRWRGRLASMPEWHLHHRAPEGSLGGSMWATAPALLAEQREVICDQCHPSRHPQPSTPPFPADKMLRDEWRQHSPRAAAGCHSLLFSQFPYVSGTEPGWPRPHGALSLVGQRGIKQGSTKEIQVMKGEEQASIGEDRRREPTLQKCHLNLRCDDKKKPHPPVCLY